MSRVLLRPLPTGVLGPEGDKANGLTSLPNDATIVVPVVLGLNSRPPAQQTDLLPTELTTDCAD